MERSTYTPGQREALGGVIALMACDEAGSEFLPKDIGWDWRPAVIQPMAISDTGVIISSQDLLDAALVVAMTALRDLAAARNIEVSEVIAEYGVRLVISSGQT